MLETAAAVAASKVKRVLRKVALKDWPRSRRVGNVVALGACRAAPNCGSQKILAYYFHPIDPLGLLPGVGIGNLGVAIDSGINVTHRRNR